MKVSAEKLILSLLLAAAALSGSAGETVITYRSRPDIPLHCSDSLRRFEHFLKELFPRTLHPPKSLTIQIVNAPGTQETSGENILEVNRFRLEKNSLELLSEVGGAMLHAQGKAPAGFRLPLFLCGAFRHRERSAGKECRFLGNNRRFRSAESLVRQGVMPELKKLLTHRPGEQDLTGNEWFDDHARLLFEMLRSRGFKGSAAELENAATKLLAQKITTGEITPLIWNNFNPLPPELADRELDPLYKILIPRLDHMNEVTSLSDTVELNELPLKLRKHPQREAICSKLAASLLQRSVRLPAVLRSPLRKLHDSTLRLGKDRKAEREFLNALSDLNKARELYRQRSAALDKLENETPCPVRMWRRSLHANSLPPGIITVECDRYLDRMEEYFIGI